MAGLLDQSLPSAVFSREIDDRIMANRRLAGAGAPFGSLRSYEPGYMDRAINFLGGLLGDDRRSHRTARKVKSLLDWVPVVGDTQAAVEALDAYNKEEYIKSGLLSSAAALGVIPLVGDIPANMLRQAVKAIPPSQGIAIREATTAQTLVPKSMTDAPDLRIMSQDEAIKQARTEVHLIQGKDGQFIGGPRGAVSMGDIVSARKAFDENVAEGLMGADWYTRGRRFNVISQPSAAAASRAAIEQARWSPQSDPDPNLNWAIHARTGMESGDMPRLLRTGKQVESHLVDKPLGRKTSIYGQHLDPSRPHATTGTNDIWHARAFGFKGDKGKEFDRALSDQEHRFLDYETMLAVDRANRGRLGGRNDWDGAEIQAAAWVAKKGRKVAKDRNLTVAEGIAEARKSYPEYASKYTVSVPHEQIPGKSTGILPGLLDAPYETKAAFSRDAQWSGGQSGRRHGADVLSSDVFGGYTLPSQKGVGVYRNVAGGVEYNPVTVGRQMVPFESSGAKRYISRHAKEGLDAQQAVRGLLDMQEGSSWGKVITHSSGPFTAFNLNVAKSPTKSQMKRALEISQKHNIEVIANKDGGLAFAMMHNDDLWKSSPSLYKKTPTGRVSKRLDEKAVARHLNKLLKGDLGNELSAVFKGAEFERGIWSGGYIDLSEELALKSAGKGLGTKAVLDQLGSLRKNAPGFYENLVNSKGVQIKAQKNLARYQKWLGKLGDKQRDDYVKLLEIVGKDKLKGLVNYVKKYGAAGLPAIAAVAISSSLRDVRSGRKSGLGEDRT